jgi:hypothetical protein
MIFRYKKSLTILMIGCLAICLTATAGFAAQYPYLYKSQRAIGMGGAYVAIGGKVDTLFYNPAGLSMMPEDNWEFSIATSLLAIPVAAASSGGEGPSDAAAGFIAALVLINSEAEFNTNVRGFIADLSDALDEDDEDEQLRLVNAVIKEYVGKNMHIRVGHKLLTMGRNGEKIGFGLTAYGNADIDLKTHQGFGSGGMIGINGDILGGPTVGMSYKLRDDLFVGGALKYYGRANIDYDLTVRAIVDEDADIDEEIEDSAGYGGAIGADMGVIYSGLSDREWYYPTLGLSFMNMGMDFGDAGEMPMTVNFGLSAGKENPDQSYFKHFIVGFDYVDLFKGYEEDDDIGKRMRFGGELGLFENKYIGMNVRTGLYQGYTTFGTDLRLTIVTLAYTTYAEEIGAYAGQEKDRRHILSLNVGW